MKNSIKAVRAAEAARIAAENKAKAEKEMLEKVEPVDMVGAMDEVINKTARSVRDSEGYTTGTNGGTYLQRRVHSTNGQLQTIGAKTEEELDAIETRMSTGVSGDGLLHKVVYIGGIPCDCCGATEEELEKDILAAKVYYQQHKGNVLKDIYVAEDLVEAEYKKDDLEVVKDDYIICYSGKYVMSTDGTTIATLDDLKGKLPREDIKTILTDRLEAYIAEHQYDDVDCEEECDEDCDEDCDDYE